MTEAESLLEVLEQVVDPRQARGVRYRMVELLAIAVGAMLSGCHSLYAIAQWAKDHQEEVVLAFHLRRPRTPCVGTFHYAFKHLDQDQFETVLGAWACRQGLKKREGIAIDGKTLRGIHGEEVPGVHLLSAYSHESGAVLFQKDVGEKGNELTVAPTVLNALDLREHVVTGDAGFTQRNLCQLIVEKGGTTTCASRTTSPP